MTASGSTVAAGRAATVQTPRKRGGRRRSLLAAGVFLLPALILLGSLVLYPIIFTVVRSLFDRAGDTFVGLGNYVDMFTSPRTLTAIRNNAIWVLVAPTVVTAVGLVFAVLTERVRWGTAFKVAVFMPMAISFLAAGVIWRVVYEQEPDKGLANAALNGVVQVFREPGPYPGARPAQTDVLVGDPGGTEGFTTTAPVSQGPPVGLGLIGIPPRILPEEAEPAARPAPAGEAVTGVVWLDFRPGGGGERGSIDEGELGLPGVTVQALRDGEVVGETVTEPDGSFALHGLGQGGVQLRLPADTFRPAWRGVPWLGPALVTPAIIISFLWIWAGFAMVVIGAGLAAIPRDVLEAARVDGASEWQVFRRVTAPLLMPVILVVLVTLAINVLKIFDLVLIIPPGSVQADANVLALEMWRVSFGGARDQGLGSALAVLLFLLVLPAMLFNLKRFRSEQS